MPSQGSELVGTAELRYGFQCRLTVQRLSAQQVEDSGMTRQLETKCDSHRAMRVYR